MDEFDELLRRAIEETINYIFGDINAQIIFNYLERKGCGLKQVPAKPRLFSAELRNILGTGRGQLLGAAPILEEAILEALCGEIRVKFERFDGKSFSDHIESLRKSYRKRANEGSPPMHVSCPKGGNEDPAI